MLSLLRRQFSHTVNKTQWKCGNDWHVYIKDKPVWQFLEHRLCANWMNTAPYQSYLQKKTTREFQTKLYKKRILQNFPHYAPFFKELSRGEPQVVKCLKFLSAQSEKSLLADAVDYLAEICIRMIRYYHDSPIPSTNKNGLEQKRVILESIDLLRKRNLRVPYDTLLCALEACSIPNFPDPATAENILEEIISNHRMTEIALNLTLAAYWRCKNPDASSCVKLLQKAVNLGVMLTPSTYTYMTSVMARQIPMNKVACKELLESMVANGVAISSTPFNIYISRLAREEESNLLEEIERVIDMMKSCDIQPTIPTYSVQLSAMLKAPEIGIGDYLSKVERVIHDLGEATTEMFAMCIYKCSKQKPPDLQMSKAIYQDMRERGMNSNAGVYRARLAVLYHCDPIPYDEYLGIVSEIEEKNIALDIRTCDYLLGFLTKTDQYDSETYNRIMALIRQQNLQLDSKIYLALIEIEKKFNSMSLARLHEILNEMRVNQVQYEENSFIYILAEIRERIVEYNEGDAVPDNNLYFELFRDCIQSNNAIASTYSNYFTLLCAIWDWNRKFGTGKNDDICLQMFDRYPLTNSTQNIDYSNNNNNGNSNDSSSNNINSAMKDRKISKFGLNHYLSILQEMNEKGIENTLFCFVPLLQTIVRENVKKASQCSLPSTGPSSLNSIVCSFLRRHLEEANIPPNWAWHTSCLVLYSNITTKEPDIISCKLELSRMRANGITITAPIFNRYLDALSRTNTCTLDNCRKLMKMMQEEGITVDQDTYAPLFTILSKDSSSTSQDCYNIIKEMSNQGLSLSKISYNPIMSIMMHEKPPNVKGCKDMLDESIKRGFDNDVTWRIYMHALLTSDPPNLVEAKKTLEDSITRRMKLDVGLCNMYLSAMDKTGIIDSQDCIRFLRWMESHEIIANTITYNTIVRNIMSSSNPDIHKCIEILKEMQEKNIESSLIACNIAIQAAAKKDPPMLNECLEILNLTKKNKNPKEHPNQYTWSSLMTAAARMNPPDLNICETAFQEILKIEKPSVRTYNKYFNALYHHPDNQVVLQRCLELIVSMNQYNCPQDSYTLNTSIGILSRNKTPDIELFWSIIDYAIKQGVRPDFATIREIIHGQGKTPHYEPDMCLTIVKEMWTRYKVKPSLYTFNIIMKSFYEDEMYGMEMGWELLELMDAMSVLPSENTLKLMTGLATITSNDNEISRIIIEMKNRGVAV